MTKQKKNSIINTKKLDISKFVSYKTIIIFIALIVVVIYITFPNNYNSYINKGEDLVIEEKPLVVTYKNGMYIELDNFNHSFRATKEIIVENTSNKAIFYDVTWRGITNNIRNKPGFTYVLTKNSDDKIIKKGEVPKASSRLLYKERLKPKSKNVYTITFNYKKGKGSKKDLFKCYFDVRVHSNNLKNKTRSKIIKQ